MIQLNITCRTQTLFGIPPHPSLCSFLISFFATPWQYPAGSEEIIQGTKTERGETEQGAAAGIWTKVLVA